MTDAEILEGMPGGQSVQGFDRLPTAARVADLLRLPDALERWQRRCAEAFQESRARIAAHKEWQQQRVGHRPRILTLDELENWPANEPIKQHPDDYEPYVGGPLPFSAAHVLSLADCYLVLALLYDTIRRDGVRIVPDINADLFASVFYEVMRQHLAGLHAADQITINDCLGRVEMDLKSGQGADAEPGSDAIPQFVTLDQAAAIVNRSKKTLERAMNRPTKGQPEMPAPDREGGGGKPHEWNWCRLRPWLEAMYGTTLPKRLPSRSSRLII